ncbi:myo-inositol-1-phosphate synthase [Bradyrhizobium liaoningense]
MAKSIRVGLVGVGNNASAMVQGVHFYSKDEARLSLVNQHHGILFPRLCGYDIGDISFSCAFDVDDRKIGLDLGEAIWSPPNNYPRVVTEEIKTKAQVMAAPVLDGVPEFLTEAISISSHSQVPDDAVDDALARCTEQIRSTGTTVLVNFLPSGSDLATSFFARAAALAGSAYINCTPTPAVHSPEIHALFAECRVPLLGDDLESHFGSSLLHRTLLQALEQRGLEITHSHQINMGGNTDFKNLTHRGNHKKRSKMAALGFVAQSDRVNILPSGGFVPGLEDRKVAYILIEGLGWLGSHVTIDLKLQVQDSSNAAGVVVDLVRIAQAGVDRGIAGNLAMPYYFKRPLSAKPNTADALQAVREFDQAMRGQ